MGWQEVRYPDRDVIFWFNFAQCIRVTSEFNGTFVAQFGAQGDWPGQQVRFRLLHDSHSIADYLR